MKKRRTDAPDTKKLRRLYGPVPGGALDRQVKGQKKGLANLKKAGRRHP